MSGRNSQGGSPKKSSAGRNQFVISESGEITSFGSYEDIIDSFVTISAHIQIVAQHRLNCVLDLSLHEIIVPPKKCELSHGNLMIKQEKYIKDHQPERAQLYAIIEQTTGLLSHRKGKVSIEVRITRIIRDHQRRYETLFHEFLEAHKEYQETENGYNKTGVEVSSVRRAIQMSRRRRDSDPFAFARRRRRSRSNAGSDTVYSGEDSRPSSLPGLRKRQLPDEFNYEDSSGYIPLVDSDDDEGSVDTGIDTSRSRATCPPPSAVGYSSLSTLLHSRDVFEEPEAKLEEMEKLLAEQKTSMNEIKTRRDRLRDEVLKMRTGKMF